MTRKEKLEWKKLRVHVKELKLRFSDIEAHLGAVASAGEAMIEVESSVGILIERAKRTPEELKAITARIEHLDGRLEMAVEEVPEMHERLGDVERSLSSLVEQANKLAEKPDAIFSRLQQIDSRLAGLAFDKIEERLSDMERSLYSLVQAAGETPCTLRAVLSRLEDLEHRLEMTPEVISDELDERLSSVNTRLDGILALNQLPEQLITLLSQMEQIEARLTRESGLAFDDLAARMNDMERSLSSLLERRDQTPDGFATIISRLEHLEIYLASLAEVTNKEIEAQLEAVTTRLIENIQSEQYRTEPISEGELSGVAIPAWQITAKDPDQTFSDPDESDFGCLSLDEPLSESSLVDTAVTNTSELEDRSIPDPSQEMFEIDSQETLIMEKAIQDEPWSEEVDAATSESDQISETDAIYSSAESVEDDVHVRWFKKKTAPRRLATNGSETDPTRDSKNNNDADKEMIDLVLSGPANQFRRENLREPANWIGTCRFETDPEELVRDCCVLDISTVGARLEFYDTALEEIADRQIIFSNHLIGEIRYTELNEYGTVIVGVEFLNFAQDDELAREAQRYIQSLKRVAGGTLG